MANLPLTTLYFAQATAGLREVTIESRELKEALEELCSHVSEPGFDDLVTRAIFAQGYSDCSWANFMSFASSCWQNVLPKEQALQFVVVPSDALGEVLAELRKRAMAHPAHQK